MTCACPTHIEPKVIDDPLALGFLVKYREEEGKASIAPKRFHDEPCLGMNWETALDMQRHTGSWCSLNDPDNGSLDPALTADAIEQRHPNYLNDACRWKEVFANTNKALDDGDLESGEHFVFEEAASLEDVEASWDDFLNRIRRFRKPANYACRLCTSAEEDIPTRPLAFILLPSAGTQETVNADVPDVDQ